MTTIAFVCFAADVMLTVSIQHFIAPAPPADSIIKTSAIVRAAIAPPAAPVAMGTATITRITDGDTVDAKFPDGFEHSIRLAGIVRCAVDWAPKVCELCELRRRRMHRDESARWSVERSSSFGRKTSARARSRRLLDTEGCRISSEPVSGPVVGNERSHIFEWKGCPYYDAISTDDRVPFASPQAAEAAGYRPAHNCP